MNIDFDIIIMIAQYLEVQDIEKLVQTSKQIKELLNYKIIKNENLIDTSYLEKKYIKYKKKYYDKMECEKIINNLENKIEKNMIKNKYNKIKTIILVHINKEIIIKLDNIILYEQIINIKNILDIKYKYIWCVDINDKIYLLNNI